MTGYEALVEELLARGFTKQQASSKVVAGVLDIVAGKKDLYVTLRNDIEEVNARMALAESERKRASGIRERAEKEAAEIKKQADLYVKENKAYIEAWLSDLEKCETPEGRDRMRAAQVFVNTVTVNTKYDNTAFIVGIAALLEGTRLNAVAELKKINKELPEIDEWETIRSDRPLTIKELAKKQKKRV